KLGAALPFPTTQAQMGEYQKKKVAGEIIWDTGTKKWYKSS
ncbi:unnamed protein product, partial [marine sediment metagenome]